MELVFLPVYDCLISQDNDEIGFILFYRWYLSITQFDW